jgi:hypothetical protein
MATASQPSTPNGDHPLVAAQRKNLGPLSAAGKDVWHGNATPCVTCGQLVPRTGARCESCGQDHGADLLQKMARHSGPWFVYDHVRPFPGVSLERVRKLIERQVLTRCSIVRGPTTYYQWRFAGETPLIAPLLGYCWNCQTRVLPGGGTCSECGVGLDGHVPAEAAQESGPAPEAPDEELRALANLAASRPRPDVPPEREAAATSGGLSFIFFTIAVVVVLAIVMIAKAMRT